MTGAGSAVSIPPHHMQHAAGDAMNDQATSVDEASGTDPKQTRQRSAIGFPYSDFTDAAKLAEAIHSNVGYGTCSLSQLAAWTSQSVKSSGYRAQVAAARLFGLLESEGSDSYRLTPLGKQLADPNTTRKAKAEAFLNVPLFEAIYKNHKDGVLPPPQALEREIAGLGVSEKQKDRARQIFERSAEQTGYFEFGKNRLVMPANAVREEGQQQDPPPGAGTGGTNGTGSGGGADEGLSLDPLLMALLRKIPSVEEGWPRDKRLRWFKTFAMNVSQVYDSDEEPVEFNITG